MSFLLISPGNLANSETTVLSGLIKKNNRIEALQIIPLPYFVSYLSQDHSAESERQHLI